MSFISAGFFMAMALTACLYYLIPKKYQWELLLFVSFGFYATYGIRYMGYILFTIITSYCITRLMAAQKEKLMRRRWLIFGLVSNFGILVFLKYVNFTILNLTSLFSVKSSTPNLLSGFTADIVASLPCFLWKLSRAFMSTSETPSP